MKTRVSLTYEGEAVDGGRMDVYEVAKNMVAFSEFMTVAVKTTYGDQAEAHAEVAGFKEGSFETDFVLNVIGPAASLLTAWSPGQLWEVVKNCFDLWKFLRGHPPSSVTHNENRATVTNNFGEVNQFNIESLIIVMSPQGVDAVTKFVKEPLRHSGVSYVRIERQDDATGGVVEVTDNESEFFTQVAREETVSDNVVQMVVQVVGPEFQDGRKWRFTAGENTFTAAMEDANFLARVDAGERFGKGDALDVNMRVVQKMQNRKISVERSVVRVLRHIAPIEQLGFS